MESILKTSKIIKSLIRATYSGLAILLFITLSLLNISIIFASTNEQAVIAITKIVEHPSLVQAEKGIMDVLSEHGYEVGKNLRVIEKNAQGSIANAALIAGQFASLSPDAIVAISTPSAQTVKNAIIGTDIPLVFSSVTDPVSAGLVKNLTKPVQNITGAIDFPLINEEIKLMQDLLPKVQTIGFLYNSGEANSVKTVNLMKQAMAGDLKYIEMAITDSNQITQGFSNLLSRVDAIYIPSDNAVFAAMPKLVNMSRKHKMPIFSSDPDSVKQGILACIGYTQYEVGRTAGELLVGTLSGSKKLLVKKPSKAEIFINQRTADIMKIKIPSKLLDEPSVTIIK